MSGFNLRGAIFPLTLIAFEAVGVRYWGTIFNDKTRWVLLAVLFLTLLLRGRLWRAFGTGAGFLLGAYLLWCVCTTAWSEVPALSLAKTSALIVIVLTLFAAGHDWASNSERNSPLGFLLPIVILALFAGLFGSGETIKAGTITIYEGLADGPNMLGSLVAMSFPYAVWQAYRSRPGSAKRLLFLAIAFALLLVLWRSGSRASMLCVLSTFAVFIVALNPAKRMMALGLIAIIGLGTAVALPAVQSALYERFIVKGGEAGSELYTRQDVWSESYEQAKKGGFFGGGYGVSIGEADSFSPGSLTAVGYGREKGNTQLAVWEETGIVGLILYTSLILAIVLELGSGFVRTRDRQSKVELGLLLGAVVGFTIQSIFEAWWVAPGSPEFAYFWAIVGAAYALSQRSSRRVPSPQRANRPAPSGAAVTRGI